MPGTPSVYQALSQRYTVDAGFLSAVASSPALSGFCSTCGRNEPKELWA